MDEFENAYDAALAAKLYGPQKAAGASPASDKPQQAPGSTDRALRTLYPSMETTGAERIVDAEQEDMDEQTQQIAKRYGLDHDKMLKYSEDMLNAQETQHKQQARQWYHESLSSIPRADIQHAQQLTSEFSTEFRQMLDQTGYGNNPLVIKELARISKALQGVQTRHVKTR